MSEARAPSPSSDALSDGMGSLSIRDKALLKRSVSKHHNNNFKAGYVPVHEQYLTKTGLRGRKTLAFWTLVVLLFVLAVGNLILTMVILGVLRMGRGMQSLEHISEDAAIKFYGNTDLGDIYKRDGKLESYADVPMEITSQGGSIRLNLSVNERSSNKVTLEQYGTYLRGFEALDVHSTKGDTLFSTTSPLLNSLRNAQNLESRIVETSRIVSSLNSALKLESRNITLKGAEGTLIDGREVIWNAGEDIYLKSINGSLVLSGTDGIFLNFAQLDGSHVRHGGSSQYKLCVCMPQGKLFRVRVQNNTKTYCHEVRSSQGGNPCN